jgi:hypothetical protein
MLKLKQTALFFQTEEGDVFDCIDIHKQPAFDHPLLKNHSIQVKPHSHLYVCIYIYIYFII